MAWFRSVLALAFFLPASTAVAMDLAGAWEIQSMGGDRKVQIKQRGDRVIAHRVLWPEFEGEKYKLEHLYRGRVSGSQISGKLLVKEDELPDYEVLRAFSGKVASASKIIIDGLPMKRIGDGGKAKGEVPPKTTKEPARISEPPPLAQNNPPPPPPPPGAPPPSPGATAPNEGSDDLGVNLFANIMGGPGAADLFQVSSRINIPDAAADLAEEGDAKFDAGDFAVALAKYEEASSAAGGAHVQLLHRKGRCYLRLGKWKEAKASLRRALKLDPNNKKIRRDYKKAKRRTR